MEVLNQGLSSIQIMKHLETVPGFIGCFPSNKIPSIDSYPCSFIINTAKSGHPGDHWVALHCREDVSFYFDSFGIPLIETDIIQFMKKYYKKVIYNRKCIQDVSSVACGLFCISFIKNVYSLKSYNLFVNHFTFNNLKANDFKVLQFI